VQKIILLYALFFLFLGCATDPVVQENQDEPFPKSPPSVYTQYKTVENQYNDIDLNSLSQELNMGRGIQTLGYDEKLFNTCKVKSNKSPRPYCENLYFSQLHFQMMCRDSTGTVDTVQLTPLFSDQLRWKSHGHKGFTQTNSQGFGRLDFVSKQSARQDHLYFYIGNKIARKSLKDFWKLILPQAWCAEH